MSEFMLSENATRFFIYSYFGINEPIDKSQKNDIVKKCARRAYLDFNRTLRFDKKTELKGTKKIKEEHEKFCNNICEKIGESIIELFEAKDFDTKHDEICKEIKKEATNSKKEDGTSVLTIPFHYGQAQKWLNMTLKYMWLIGLWEKELENILPMLHVPVDNIIIKEAWKDNTITLPCDENKRKLNYKEEYVERWSKWEYKEYREFQRSLRDSRLLGKKTPIEWENEIWMQGSNK